MNAMQVKQLEGLTLMAMFLEREVEGEGKKKGRGSSLEIPVTVDLKRFFGS